ncbi:hypothetical protein [Lentzea flava]|uniref:Uncharacterized protein n=1 Tax=Lentzea flava TaxID=103732 RepID=A0ABQ2UE39_9PSEU|nr:hypothetical protein [Lentzea flava]MCP2198497.1 hypothetical protein [Lentzea flava]GGU26285.1 hypothetical protein GCM10010178_18270 [Lentzea flava]
MATEILTEELLRTSLVRLAREVVKTHPEFGEVLTQNNMRSGGLIPAPERAKYYQELGALLIDLGRLYLAKSDALMEPSEKPGSEDLVR